MRQVSHAVRTSCSQGRALVAVVVVIIVIIIDIAHSTLYTCRLHLGWRGRASGRAIGGLAPVRRIPAHARRTAAVTCWAAGYMVSSLLGELQHSRRRIMHASEPLALAGKGKSTYWPFPRGPAIAATITRRSHIHRTSLFEEDCGAIYWTLIDFMTVCTGPSLCLSVRSCRPVHQCRSSPHTV